MSDWTLDPHVTLVFGAQKSGKTSLCFRYLLNAADFLPVACIFIFDDRGQAQARLGYRPSGTERECELALASRIVCFNPHVMFQMVPGKTTAKEALQNAFRWFCDWAMKKSKLGPGRKILFCDEVWQFMDCRNCPDELENVARCGRPEDLELIMATHRPSEYHRNIRALVTEFVGFNTIDDLDLEALKGYFPEAERLRNLRRGEFIAVNRDGGGQLSGKLW